MSPAFRYTAKNWEGVTSEGTCTAESLREALEYLRSQDLFVINIKEAGRPRERSSPAGWSIGALRRKKAKSRELMVFCRQFATMLQAGMTVLQILRVLAEQSEHASFQERLRDIALGVEKGGSLAEGFARHAEFFPRLVIAMVEAGEAGGILENVMDRLAAHFARQFEMEEKIRSATTYPVIISVVAILVLNLMVFFVLPRFAEIFAGLGLEMPWLTRGLIALADTVFTFWYLFLGLLAALAAGLVSYLRTDRGKERFDFFRLKAPVFGPIYRKAVVARFSRTLGTLLASGVNLVPSLELVERVIDNVIFSRALSKARQVIRQGQPMAVPLAASGLFPPMLVEMVHVGEESGTLEGMLSRTADFYEQEVTFVLDRLSTVIEPLLLIVIGFFVGILVVSLILPMFSIYEMI